MDLLLLMNSVDEREGRRRYRISRGILEQSRELLAEAGAVGLESAVVWVGRLLEPSDAEVLRVERPEQLCFRTEAGVGVEILPEAISRLIADLQPGTLVLARLHSHPGCPYHSDVDDLNMLISHDGAISIVVPDFAAAPIDLTDCSVNELRHGQGWIELDAAEVTTRFRIT
ncbi:MAG: hypothetical protein ACM3N0_12375 [Chloroflexota bacterium]